MKQNRRRLASVEAAIIKLGLTKTDTKVLNSITGPAPPALDNGFRPLWPAPVTQPPPAWLTPCTSKPVCGACWACRVAEHGPDWWTKGIA